MDYGTHMLYLGAWLVCIFSSLVVYKHARMAGRYCTCFER